MKKLLLFLLLLPVSAHAARELQDAEIMKLNSYFSDANALLAKGDYSGALDKLTAILLKDPGNAVAREQIYQVAQLMNAGLGTMGQGPQRLTLNERADAVELAYRSLRKASPRVIERRLQEAAELETRKFYLLASQVYLSIIQLPKLDLEKKYQIEKRLRSANLKIDAKIETLPEGSRGLYREAFTLLSVGDLEGSVDGWLKYLEKHSRDTEVQKLLNTAEARAAIKEKENLKQAYAALEQEDSTKAATLFSELLKANPGNGEAAKGLEVAHQRTARAQKKETVDRMMAEAEVLIKKNKIYPAIQLLTGAVKEDPSDNRVLSMIQSVMQQAGSQKTVIVNHPVIQRVIVEKTADNAPEVVDARDMAKAETHYQKGLVYYSLRNYREAFTEWKAAVQFDPASRKITQALQRVQSDLQFEKSK